MIIDDINKIRKKVRQEAPLIHSITNPISINQCANACLSLGARPIMAEHPKEVKEITKTSKALLLNLGNITDIRRKSMMISAKIAKKENIPIVLDLVGVSCSDLRKKFSKKLIKAYTPSVIKGNYSEISALYNDNYKCSGVDAENTLSIENIDDIAIKLSNKLGSIILASGKSDVVAFKNTLIHIKNGTEYLQKVTGTGCMQGEVLACFLAASNDVGAVVTAAGVLGICGELSKTQKGAGSFMVNLMDNLSKIKDEDIEKYLKIEVKEIEGF